MGRGGMTVLLLLVVFVAMGLVKKRRGLPSPGPEPEIPVRQNVDPVNTTTTANAALDHQDATLARAAAGA